MGDVIALVKVMPAGKETDLETLKTAIEGAVPDGIELHGIEEKPVAFGLVALNVTVEMPDEGGNTDRLEEALAALDDVESAEVTDVGRAL